MIAGINHVTFAVRDLSTSLAFYVEVLGCEPIARWNKAAYVAAGALWVALVRDPRRNPEACPDYTHLALTVAPDDFERLSARIRASGATVWQDNTSEGASLYFLDPDGHKLEIHVTDLAARLTRLRARPPEGFQVLAPLPLGD